MNTYIFKTHSLDTYVVRARNITEARGYLFEEGVNPNDISDKPVNVSDMSVGVKKV